MNHQKRRGGRILAALLSLWLLLGLAPAMAQTAVKNGTDREGPKLTDFKFTQDGKTLKPGKTLKLSVRAQDRSGVEDVEVKFTNEQEEASFWVPLSYSERTGLFEGSYKLRKNQLNGEYVVSELNARDRFGNRTGYLPKSGTAALGAFTLTGAASSKEAPEVEAEVSVDLNRMKVSPLDQIRVSGILHSGLSNISRVYAEFTYDQGAASYTYSCACSYDASMGYFTGSFSFGRELASGEIQCNYPSGLYELLVIRACDANGNTLARALTGGQSVTLKSFRDEKAPKIAFARLAENGSVLKAGDTVHILADIRDDSEVTAAYAYLYRADESWKLNKKTSVIRSGSSDSLNTRLTYNRESGTWEGEYTLSRDTVNGKYRLAIEAQDRGAHWGHKQFSKQSFTFEDSDYVTEEIRGFVQRAVSTITGNDATESQVEQYGLPLAGGREKAVQVLKRMAESAGLTSAEKVNRLYLLMAGKAPDGKDLAAWQARLDGDAGQLEALLDTLAEKRSFRNLCQNAGIQPGAFGRSAEGVEPGAVGVKKIRLNEKKAKLKVKEKLQLKATVTPKNATDASVTWSSSDPSVATVSKKGKVKAVGAGTCVITCTARDGSGKTAECRITVKK